MVIDTVKPSAVAVVLPNVGVNAAASEVSVAPMLGVVADRA